MRSFHRPDWNFYQKMIRIAAPIMLQQAVTSGLALVDNMLVGQLGDSAVAGVALANQVYTIMSLVIFGLSSGTSIFIAQFWGREDERNIRKVLGLSLTLGISVSLAFSILSFLFPSAILGIFSEDEQVVRIGAEYLRIVCIYYPFFAISMIFSSALRSTRHVHLPMAVSGIALMINTSLGYLLIFGKLGLPAMGVRGAAYAIIFARLLECGFMVALTYLSHAPVAATPGEMLSFDLPFAKQVLKTSLPVIINETFWSIGYTMYSLVYAHISTEAITATNVANNIENLMFIPFIAIGQTCAIMVGNEIGAGNLDEAYNVTRKILRLAIGGGLLMGLAMFFCMDAILGIYQITDSARSYARQVMIILECLFCVKSSNYIMFIGILRGGGDTKFALVFEMSSMWLYGVPLACVLAFVFHLPVNWVYAGVISEEALKFCIAWWRYFSKKWIHQLSVPELEPARE